MKAASIPMIEPIAFGVTDTQRAGQQGAVIAKIGADGDYWEIAGTDQLDDEIGSINAIVLSPTSVNGSPSVSGVSGSGIARKSESSDVLFETTSEAIFDGRSWTIAAFCKFSTSGFGAQSANLIESSTFSGTVITIFIFGSGGSSVSVEFFCGSQDSIETALTGIKIAGNDQWFHVALVRNIELGEIIAYVDGVELDRDALGGVGFDHSAESGKFLQLIRSQGGLGGSRTFTVDKLLMAPSALTADEIAWLYNNGNGQTF